MKKILLALGILFQFAFHAQAQIITNTTWRINDMSDNLTGYFRFDNDSMAISSDNISYSHVSRFTESGIVGKFFNDVVSCNFLDTGTYQLILQGPDTLWFQGLGDNCSARAAFMVSHYCIRMPTGVQEQQPFARVTVFPNPAADGLFNFNPGNEAIEKIVVRDVQGKVIAEEIPAAMKFILDLGKFPAGVYFLTMSGEEGVRTMRLVK